VTVDVVKGFAEVEGIVETDGGGDGLDGEIGARKQTCGAIETEKPNGLGGTDAEFVPKDAEKITATGAESVRQRGYGHRMPRAVAPAAVHVGQDAGYKWRGAGIIVTDGARGSRNKSNQSLRQRRFDQRFPGGRPMRLQPRAMTEEMRENIAAIQATDLRPG